MGRITITISDELETEFRKVLGRTQGFKKGNLQTAVEEAIQNWIKEKKET